MPNSQLKDQILKTVFRRIGHLPKKNVPLHDITMEFDHIEKRRFIVAATELMTEQLLVERGIPGGGYVALTPDGWDRAWQLLNPPAMVNQNSINIGNAENTAIQQQGNQGQQTQNVSWEMPTNEYIQRMVDLMTKHLDELKLSQENERSVKAQLATIQAQLMDKPNPIIVSTAWGTIKSITEGAIGSLLAARAQPGIWDAINAMMASLP